MLPEECYIATDADNSRLDILTLALQTNVDTTDYVGAKVE